ncbi:hypothetical protein ACFYXH_03290 [Streptomyces sp. NPDC002730]|uniref:hypothetical protein n=1 Tax=Streptomyces sp. NPDC002730 TaxID=3364662 RepID=UPI0036B4AC59
MRGIAFMASFDQARAFAAACAEHASGILFWTLSRSGREEDLEVYLRALETLWETGPVDLGEATELHQRLMDLPEFESAHEPGGLKLAARSGARALAAGVAMLIDESPEGAIEPSSFARRFALELGRRCDADLLAREDEAQNHDVETVFAWSGELPGPLVSLRMAAAELGRVYLDTAVAAFREGEGEEGRGAMELRVTAVPDREDIIAAYADATRHYGVVGRVVAGADAGRYIRVDKLVDLAETDEEREEAVGVMIRVADDPEMEINCIGEWVEDWAGVEESFERDERQVDWPS